MAEFCGCTCDSAIEYAGQCSRCKATVTAHMHLESSGGVAISPAPVIGSYCECGDRQARGGIVGQAVPLTLRGDLA